MVDFSVLLFWEPAFTNDLFSLYIYDVYKVNLLFVRGGSFCYFDNFMLKNKFRL